jgi:hypothetical protein
MTFTSLGQCKRDKALSNDTHAKKIIAESRYRSANHQSLWRAMANRTLLFVGKLLLVAKLCLAFQSQTRQMTKLTAFFPTVKINKRCHHLLPSREDNSMVKRSLSSTSSTSDENKRGKVDAVDALLSSMTSQTWRNALEGHFKSSMFRKLAEFVEKERRSQTVYPPASDVWTALNSCEIDDIKVVIVGQDPYHGPVGITGSYHLILTL